MKKHGKILKQSWTIHKKNLGKLMKHLWKLMKKSLPVHEHPRKFRKIQTYICFNTFSPKTLRVEGSRLVFLNYRNRSRGFRVGRGGRKIRFRKMCRKHEMSCRSGSGFGMGFYSIFYTSHFLYSRKPCGLRVLI